MKYTGEDDCGDEVEIDESKVFMASEVPLLISQAVEWINKRNKQKMKDQIFIKDFAPERNRMKDTYQIAS